VFLKDADPDLWASAVRESGYRAAYLPVDAEASDDVVRAYVRAAKAADILIAEVGAWSNPISPDDAERRRAIAFCQKQLALADRVAARCCVNIAGSRGNQWDGPHLLNLAPETFDLIVETVRQIVDAVQPTRTYYTLETMPWVFPDSPESYLRLIQAIDRRRFAVHLDPVNLVNCPERFYNSAALLRECFAQLGPYIKSCHAKAIALSGRLTVHLDEVRPGQGGLDYGVFLQELGRLDPDTPLMLEHLSDEPQFKAAADYIRSVAKKVKVKV